MTRFATIALVAAAAFASVPALAAEPTDVLTKAVSYADLDLTSAAGQARLERRIAGATRVVCVSSDPILTARCRAKANTDAKAKMKLAIARAASAERLASAAGAPVVGN